MKKIFLLIFIFLNLISSYGQDRCGLDIMTETLLEENPNVSAELDQYDRFLNTIDKSNPINTREILNIPVVVHIIYTNSSENISDSKVYSQIEILNKDYNRQNVDKIKTPSFFKDKAGVSGIQFYLASKDENGNATSGITRHEYASISSTGYIENTIKKATVWDTKKYLNIWVLRMPNQNILGYSYLPLQSILNTYKDGLVVDYQRFGYINPNNTGRTATHELGHYLGLQHPWGSQESCNSDDGISDTPNTSGPFYGCPTFPQSKCSNSSMFMNFMDYVNDNCMNMFSQGQVEVMRSVLSNQRSGLVQTEDIACSNLDVSSFEMGFESDESKSRWKKEDTNEDGNTWAFSSKSSDEWGPNIGSGYVNYQWNDNDITKGGDDYLFTPCIDIKKDVVYELTFSYACSSDANGTYPEKLEVGFSGTASSRDFSIINDDWKLDINNPYPNYNTVVYKFKSNDATSISIGFHAVSEPNQYTLLLDDIKIRNTEAVATNEVASLVGVNISPNPASTSNIVNWSILNPIYSTGSIVIYDLFGKVVNTYELQKNQKELSMDIGHLTPALYFVESILDGKRYSSKLVVTE